MDLVPTTRSGIGVQISGQVVEVSGQPVSLVSGTVVIGQSGLNVVVQSGAPVSIQSGTWVNIGSGIGIIQPASSLSGQYVQISGQGVLISGQTIVVASGVYTIPQSGLGILIGGGPGVRTRAILAVSNVSGGVTLVSGIVRSVTLKSLSGAIYVGGATGIDMPYSGFGMLLAGGEAITLDVNNFNLINACAATSGDPVSYIGVI